jgi:nucleoside-diphosphate-sugar epimerase
MAMPDAIDALLKLQRAPRERVTQPVYNITSFSPAAEEFRARVLAEFPGASITYAVDTKRQAIVDSWPEDVDDHAARADWGFAPQYDFERAFGAYLMPEIRARYGR